MNAMKPMSVVLWSLLLVPISMNAQEPAKEPAPPVAVPSPGFAPEDSNPDSSGSDPFGGSNGTDEALKIPLNRGKEVRTTLRVRLETWEIDAKKLALKLDSVHGSDALEAWRGELLADPAGVLIHSPVLVVEEKSRASAESILERIYPTEYEPPELLCTPPIAPKDPPKSFEEWMEGLGGNATPTSFETRNTGTTFEAAVQPVEAEAKCWDLAIGVDSVLLVTMENYGAKSLDIVMPAISSFRTSGLPRVKEGAWQILSAQEPPRGVDGKPTGKSWLTLIRVDRNR